MRWWLLTVVVVLALTGAAQGEVQFDGVDDVGTTGLALSAFMNASTGTVTAWVFATGTAPATGSAPYNGAGLVADDADIVALFRVDWGATGDHWHAVAYTTGTMTAHAAASPNTWQHVAWVHDGTNIILYLGGVQVASTAAGALFQVTGLVQVGKNYNGSNWFAGTATEVQLYSVALSAMQIETMALSRLRGMRWAPGTAYWPLDQCGDGAAGTGVVFADRSGNTRPLTLSAGANTTGATCRASTVLATPWGAG